MRRLCLALAVLLAGVGSCPAQDPPLTLDDLLNGAQQWAEDNLDTNFLNDLSKFHEQAVQQSKEASQPPSQDEYVVNLAPFKSAARGLLSLLSSNDDFHPVADRLRAQLDDPEVADELRIIISTPDAGTNVFVRTLLTNLPALADSEITNNDVIDPSWPADARAYIPALKRIFTAQKTPPELVWIAEVESAFDRRAISPVGAAGLFQLMPDTAKRFGLSLWPSDQRYQPEPSAAASAKYLRELHEQFQDWRLALAAYNAGEGTVQKLLDRYQAHTFEAIASHLPLETQRYVPFVEAVIQAREGVKLQDLAVPK